jgi:hypothetical protein
MCRDCARLFPAAPGLLQGHVVPLTSALEDGPWHSQLVSCRTAEPESWSLPGGLVVRFASVHAARICELLGGSPTATTVVPSKRGRPMGEQSLFRMISAAVQREPESLPPPQVLLEFAPDSPWRHRYAPGAFRVPSGECVAGSRVVLIDDCWISGATCLSAAGALLDAGVAQVVALPIARVVSEGVWGDEHPYVRAMREPYDVGRWPHGG